jgi:hypothetical protein
MPRLITPVYSPEHGAYVVVLASFLVGAIAAGGWTAQTTFALIAALAAHQAQFPVMQMLRKHRIVARLALWGSLYAVLAAISAWKVLVVTPEVMRLVWVAGSVFVIAVLLSVLGFYKTLSQELIVFAGLCLAAPWAEVATRGYMVRETLGVWVVLVVAFQGAVFAVHLRSRGRTARRGAGAYLVIGALVCWAITSVGIADIIYLWIVVPSLIRLLSIMVRPDEWEHLRIRVVGYIETGVALATVALALLLF